ncbi:hypothetical protein ERHA54_49800 (plasmid) [Erwinia rhapontici]|uniref:Uncharacterized protein n=1 Tax=Erwinia rhapontici TaxID=55212 RepID=A0ABM7N797_ERWRD|nr:hypothetical protein ERHA53_46990 [Erwinia rhapontici]BCQ42377.1 hypothetical protein ERHA54_49800 [Erwinia rhapontici]BCQ47794.1 hypothetical protein ERHA55_53210 [Erwinia rhapontici]
MSYVERFYDGFIYNHMKINNKKYFGTSMLQKTSESGVCLQDKLPVWKDFLFLLGG